MPPQLLKANKSLEQRAYDTKSNLSDCLTELRISLSSDKASRSVLYLWLRTAVKLVFFYV